MRVQRIVQAGQTVQVSLTAPILLHVVYDTAWVDNAGIVNFRRDVRGCDRCAGVTVAEAASNSQRGAA
jgi:L,D-transpeptidase YcbB